MLSKKHQSSSGKADMHHCCYCVSKQVHDKRGHGRILRDYGNSIHGDDRYFIPRYNTMKDQLKSMLDTLLCTYMPQNVGILLQNVSY